MIAKHIFNMLLVAKVTPETSNSTLFLAGGEARQLPAGLADRIWIAQLQKIVPIRG